MGDPTGHLVEYIEKNRVVLGLVQAVKKGRLGVLTSTGREVALAPGRVLLLTPSGMDPSRPRAAQTEYMLQIHQLRQQLADQVNVGELWELVHEEEQPLPPPDLAELAFGKAFSPDQLSATLRALFQERLHFKLVGSELRPLSREQLERKMAQQEVEARHQAQVDQAAAFLKSLPAQGPASQPPDGLLKLLSDLVVFGEEAPRAKLAKEILAGAELGGRRRVFDLLVRLGYYDPHENLEMRREGMPARFSQELLAQARGLRFPPEMAAGRQDLSELYTFTIDGSFTTDFDDALSFEPAPKGGGQLGVHIADAAALLDPEHPVTLEARQRASSLYLPDDRVPMLPPCLSEDLLSLREGQLRPALSCLATLDPQGRVTEWRLCRSLIRVHKRLTYEQSDQMLASDPRLKGLEQSCLDLRGQRAMAGAYFLPLPEVLVGVDEQGQVWVHRVDREGPSRLMVAETAILANWLFARYLQENQVPALYRIQAPPHEPFQEGPPEDIFLHFSQRRLLNRIEINTEPGLHSSLGLTPYTQATSPIRRYLDLVVQAQLGAALAGQTPPYGKAALEEMAMTVQPLLRRAQKVRQARHRYWLLRWLEQQAGEPQEALVMQPQLRRWQLLLSDIMLLTTIPARAGLSLEPGQRVQVRIERIDPFEDVLRVSLI